MWIDRRIKEMNNRIKKKIYKAFIKYKTDCLIGKIANFYFGEHAVIIVKIYVPELDKDVISIIGQAGIAYPEWYCKRILYVRDLKDIIYTQVFLD